uniref:Chlororespiratory reduction 4 n=1 Tax=Pelargonium dichondrifolium TaxID=73194 RepID=A0A0F7J3W3_9ROSI|nr:chlororespiratory reduction 4 [Pelargonium dichondrifolium]
MQLCVSANSNQPWNSTLPTLLLLPKCKSQNHVNQIHARIITTGFINNTSLTTKIILNFISSPHSSLLQFARYVFLSRHAFKDSRERDDPFLWNVIIKSYSHGCEPIRALTLFSDMLENRVSVDRFSFSLVLKACSRVGLLKEGMQIHGFLAKLQIGSDLFLQNCLISLYFRCGCPELARRVFSRMENLDSVSYNSMIDGYVKCGMIDSARLLFDRMPLEDKNLNSWNSMIWGYAQSEDGLKVACELFDNMPERDLVSWNSMIDGCIKCGKMEDARHLFDRMPKRDVVSWASMVDGYAKLGSVEIAAAMFKKMPNRDVIACNAMMAGYVQNGFFKEALAVFDYIRGECNLKPDATTLLIVLSAIAQLGYLDEGRDIHGYIEVNRIYLGGKLGVALIDMYSKCGSIEHAMLVFGNIEEKDVDHWNAMICGLAIHGLGELAFDLFMEMERISVVPDDITFIGVLSACAHAGLVKEGLMCFEIMRRIHRLEPKLQHFGCVVDILGRAGKLEEAWKVVEEMPIEPNDVIWRTLLSACNNHGNLKIGEPVAKHLISLDSSNSSSYVLLSNMYAGFGMWSNVSRVRTMMKERNLKKIPGCSWIELEGIVHEFLVQDKSHPQVTEICSLLDYMSTPNSEITHSRNLDLVES